MSAQSDLATVAHAVQELRSHVRLLRDSWGETLGVRRVASDVERLVTDLEEIGDPMTPAERSSAAAAGGAGAAELEIIEDRDYDPTFWEGAEEEGLGAADRHAP